MAGATEVQPYCSSFVSTLYRACSGQRHALPLADLTSHLFSLYSTFQPGQLSTKGQELPDPFRSDESMSPFMGQPLPTASITMASPVSTLRLGITPPSFRLAVNPSTKCLVTIVGLTRSSRPETRVDRIFKQTGLYTRSSSKLAMFRLSSSLRQFCTLFWAPSSTYTRFQGSHNSSPSFENPATAPKYEFVCSLANGPFRLDSFLEEWHLHKSPKSVSLIILPRQQVHARATTGGRGYNQLSRVT